MDRSIIICLVSLIFVVIHVIGGKLVSSSEEGEIGFDENYYVSWGNDNFLSLNHGREIQLSLDNYSGAGFGSKQRFGSGYFHMRIKLPANDSAGVVTAFYLTSLGDNHDELDFEFLGNREGKPITLQTNVFANGVGNREERITLWFDPTSDFHVYSLLWNQHQIVFYVDEVPIRVFKNNSNKGVKYPSKAMQIEVSLWDGESWATDGGQTKTNWSHSPFRAHFQRFDINGCSLQTSNIIQPGCNSQSYWWNLEKYWKLDSTLQKAYENVRKMYLVYDYCSDRHRYPIIPPECYSNN